MSTIFFRVNTDNPDNEPCVEVLIYNGGRDDDTEPSRHVMTIEGARTRMLDLQVAIEEAEAERNAGASRTTGGHSMNEHEIRAANNREGALDTARGYFATEQATGEAY